MYVVWMYTYFLTELITFFFYLFTCVCVCVCMYICVYVSMTVPTHHLILHAAFFNKTFPWKLCQISCSVKCTMSPVTSASLLKACKCNVVALQWLWSLNSRHCLGRMSFKFTIPFKEFMPASWIVADSM